MFRENLIIIELYLFVFPHDACVDLNDSLATHQKGQRKRVSDLYVAISGSGCCSEEFAAVGDEYHDLNDLHVALSVHEEIRL